MQAGASPRPSTRGLSPVVGTVFLVAIVVVLATLIGSTTTDISSDLERPPGFVATAGTVGVDATSNGTDPGTLVLTNRGGNTIPVDDLRVHVTVDGRTVEHAVPETGDVADGDWSSGDHIELSLDDVHACTTTGHVDVALVQTTGSRSYVIAAHTLPVVTTGFVIADGAVVPTTAYTADVELLGTAFTYGAGGPPIDIALAVTVDGTPHHPWPGNVNDGTGARTHTFTDQPANAAIAVTATADPDDEYGHARVRHSTDTESGWVAVLRDGDTPPAIGGFGDQADAAAYVQPYIAADGTLSLAPNEAIFLFELGGSQTGAAADYQDVVVLVTLQTTATTTTTDGDTATGPVIHCSTH